ncbi:hypothetical protein CRENPOLYSF1_200002 [Crenothrix polyspora]|uniref:Uncharacterized protein n=1 Tax=Crenothrix polyspora TaxID=360316 RepID=A0A1R4H6F0_9GAMM|nr:hypothetical protein CRENPOLYSF1_200002 [Crenothrix polyspora]
MTMVSNPSTKHQAPSTKHQAPSTKHLSDGVLLLAYWQY